MKWALHLDILDYPCLTAKIKDNTRYNSFTSTAFGPGINFSEYNDVGLKEIWIKEIEQNISATDALLDTACENPIFLKNIFPLISKYLNGSHTTLFYDDEFNLPIIQNVDIFIKYMLESENFRRSVKEQLLIKTCCVEYTQILDYLREKI